MNDYWEMDEVEVRIVDVLKVYNEVFESLRYWSMSRGEQ